MAEERAAPIRLYLSFIGCLSGAIILLLSDVLPVRLGFVRPDTLYVCLTEVEVAFFVLVWPLFIPSLVSSGESLRESAPRLLGIVGALLAAALPLGLIAANVSHLSLASWLRTEAAIAALALFAGALLATARERGWAVGPWFLLGAFVLSAGLPFVAFLSSTLASKDLSWLAVVSPFWASALVEEETPLALAGIFGGLAAGLLVAGTLLGKRAAA